MSNVLFIKNRASFDAIQHIEEPSDSDLAIKSTTTDLKMALVAKELLSFKGLTLYDTF